MSVDQRWRQIEQICRGVLGLEPSARDTFLDEACSGDLALREEVAGLLASYQNDSSLRPRPLEVAIHELETLWSLTSSERTADIRADAGALSTGQLLGERYRVIELLGRGGMGEVWRAMDLKLRVEVALKSPHSEHLEEERQRARLRDEVRAARSVVSPHVCRIFDLLSVDDVELVSMECIDGQTLAALLDVDGPLELRQAQEYASQLLAGLEAIHCAGLVHRDLKPANVMVTRAGRLVLMDFGLARAQTEQMTIAGTPAYMAPEQARGGAVDARADIFSAGVVLAEMLLAERDRDRPGAQQRLWAGVRQSPANLPESPWRPVLGRAVAADPTARFASAAELSRALERLTERRERTEDATPYPGLASFTQADARFFFGREAEVETLWRRLRESYLLAVIGPSGAGKSSFLRAGLAEARPDGWSVVLCQPGDAPLLSLGQTIAPELSGDTDALRQLDRFDDLEVAIALLGRWRRRHTAALLVVDQFEALFTLNSADVQQRFATLLGRATTEANVHVLLSLRDDFLLRCQDHPALRPIFSELTPITPPAGSALRRALVQPALRCGYHFEDEALVEEMVAEVTEERGALPLLAFAAARLWSDRDRETGRLTREAYQRIGGVSGALAQHAESTLEGIAREHQPMVREIFRNLVTAEGTRAARHVDELLSVFEDRDGARDVLQALIDARLVTSFEAPDKDDGAADDQRVEIIHESLLSAWPRLRRWQTQDKGGAQLRDQLRRTARLWQERERPEDLLWTGASYFEFRAWREQYPGGLSAIEQDFALAMTRLAGRKRRRRGLAMSAAVVVLLAVLGVIGRFWRQTDAALHQSEVARQRAGDEARRAEASTLYTLGKAELVPEATAANPSTALAYALKSLELDDSPRTRILALEALWRGPTAIHVGGSTRGLNISADGRWLAVLAEGEKEVALWPRDGGAARVIALRSEDVATAEGNTSIQVLPKLDIVFAWQHMPRLARIFSLSDGALLRTIEEDGRKGPFHMDPAGRLLSALEAGEIDPRGHEPWSLQGDPREFGRADLTLMGAYGNHVIATDPSKSRYWHLPLDRLATSDARLVAEQEQRIRSFAINQASDQIATGNPDGKIRIWSLAGPLEPLRVLDCEEMCGSMRFEPSGSALGALRVKGRGVSARIWDLDGPRTAGPLVLHRKDMFAAWQIRFDPGGQWIATSDMPHGTTLWPRSHRYPYVFKGPSDAVRDVVFSLDGRSLTSAWNDRIIRIPLVSSEGEENQVVLEEETWTVRSGRLSQLALAPDGRHLLAAGLSGRIWLVPVSGGEPRQLPGFTSKTSAVAFSPDGRLAAAAGGTQDPRERLIRIWKLTTEAETDESRILGPVDGPGAEGFLGLSFTADGTALITTGESGVRLWQLSDGSSRYLGPGLSAALTRDGRHLYTAWTDIDGGTGEVAVVDLETGARRPLETHGHRAGVVRLDPTETKLITAGFDGVIRVGPVSGAEPHLLLGHQDVVTSIAISPDGRWLASGSSDQTIRVWPMPEGKPFHTLPREEFLDRLRALTNLRAVDDPTSPTGYRLEAEPFTGWGDAPTW